MTGQIKQRANTGYALTAKNLTVESFDGRQLFNGLNLAMENEKVALIGRNGVGKSTLLATLAGEVSPAGGNIYHRGDVHLVKQSVDGLENSQSSEDFIRELFTGLNLFKLDIDDHLRHIGLPEYRQLRVGSGFSLGQLRKLYLLNARLRNADVVLLDDPSQDLDEAGMQWLKAWIFDESQVSQKAMIISSDDQRLLQNFEHFFLADETGCRYFGGSLTQLTELEEQLHLSQEKSYRQSLNRLADEEAHFRRVSYRREQKKNQGRVREINRGSPRTVLNGKRSCAQQSQARLAKIRGDKIAVQRDLANLARQALNADLPMEMILPKLPIANDKPYVTLENVYFEYDKSEVLRDFSMQAGREKVALVGPNGCGKTTLLKLITNELRATSGNVKVDAGKIGYIAQGGSNWQRSESLLTLLGADLSDDNLQSVIQLLGGFRFPIALAQRPLKSLAPGERMRAALLYLLSRTPTAEILVLDEPTNGLDLVAYKALKSGLKAWRGGLIVAGHDREFLKAIGVDRFINLSE